MSVLKETGPAEIAVTTVQSLLIIMNIVGNSLVCFIIVKNQDIRTPVNYLLMNLAIADIAVATFFIPQYIFMPMLVHPDGVAGTMLCRYLTGGNLAWVGAVASEFTLVAIATERYFAVMYPHGNKGKLTNRKLKVIIPCSWIFGTIMLIPGFLFKAFDKEQDACFTLWPMNWMGRAYSLAWFLILAFLPVSLMVALYSRVVYALWFKSAGPEEYNFRQKAVIKIRKRITLMVITVTAIFAVCWVTNSANYFLSYFFALHSFLSYAASSIMIMLNSAVNPIVYALINKRFREKMKGVMCCTHHQARSKVSPERELQGMEGEAYRTDLPRSTKETGESYKV